MSTQTSYEGGGLLSNAETIGWIGSGVAAKLWGPKTMAKAGMYKNTAGGTMGRMFSATELGRRPSSFFNIAYDRTLTAGSTSPTAQASYLKGSRRLGFAKGKPALIGSKGILAKQASYYSRKQMGRAIALSGRKGLGVATTAGWKAASRRGLTGQFAKLAAGKVGAIGAKLFSAGLSAQLVYGAAKSSFLMLRNEGRNAKKMEMGRPFMDSNAAYTERQRSLRAITSSRMSTRSAIGGEAALLHR